MAEFSMAHYKGLLDVCFQADIVSNVSWRHTKGYKSISPTSPGPMLSFK